MDYNKILLVTGCVLMMTALLFLGHELTMEDPLEDVQAVTNYQEPAKNAMNSSDIIQGYNGFDKPVNGSSYSDDLLSLNSQPREPEVLSPEQADPYSGHIAADPEIRNLDPVKPETDKTEGETDEQSGPGEGMLIDFGGAAANQEAEASEPSNNPFLMEEPASGDAPSSEEADPALPAQFGGGDIMQASFFGDSSELASLNPFDGGNDQGNTDLSPAAETNQFEAEHNDDENVEVCPTADTNPFESEHTEECVEVIPSDSTNPFAASSEFVEQVEISEVQPDVENRNPFELNNPSEQNGSPEHQSDGSVEPAEPSDEKIENDYMTEEDNTTVGSSVDLPIVDNVPIDSIMPEADDNAGKVESVGHSDIYDEEVGAPVCSQPEANVDHVGEIIAPGIAGSEIKKEAPKQEEEAKTSSGKEKTQGSPTKKPEASKIASLSPRSPAKEAKTKPSPAAAGAKTPKKTALLQKSSSVPSRTPMQQRPPLTRSAQLSGQSTPRKSAESKPAQSARKGTAELRRSASSTTATTASSRAKSSPSSRTSGAYCMPYCSLDVWCCHI